ncbi:MAG: hypothetical protein ACRDNK_21330 [Solirubrobacteraceae bacterium]
MRRWAGGLLAALALASCGSSGLSASQLRTSATRLCGAAAAREASIAFPERPSAGQRFLSRGIAALEPEVTELRELGAGGTFRSAVTATSAELAALRFTLKGLRAGNDPVVAIKTLQQRLLPLETKANQAWQTLGIPACVSR